MTPYTLDDADRALRVALMAGDRDEIDAASRLVDQLEERGRRALPTLHAAALWYAEHGLHVFPLQPGTKVPLKGSRGLHDGTSDPDQVNAWWGAMPEANIGIATGHGVDVVDIDGAAGQQYRASHPEMFDGLAVVGKVLTPRPGGMHLYVPASGQGNKAGLVPGIDYRGRGGYVVAPPSVIASGGKDVAGTYRFLTPLQLEHAGEAAA